ncbi:VanZ family protein [Haematobacter massiliensis]|uniref:VanZ family protein n=1 Tax=Haematobacter massiliensis TaxID=195105 RepID=UPI0023F2FEFF|nr:VanZ family protein [Haematobacter massiliensis]
MTSFQIASYLATALLYASLMTMALALVLRIAGRQIGRRGMGRGGLLLTVSTLFMITLALYPFPDRATFTCVPGAVHTQLQPFHFLPSFTRLIQTGAPFSAWVTNLTVSSTIMNYLVCMVIGLALAQVTGRWLLAATFAATLTLGIEFTQLTGNWGIYPCPYRLFDVDDLILNFAGVMTGFALWRGGQAFREARGQRADAAGRDRRHRPDPQDRPS